MALHRGAVFDYESEHGDCQFGQFSVHNPKGGQHEFQGFRFLALVFGALFVNRHDVFQGQRDKGLIDFQKVIRGASGAGSAFDIIHRQLITDFREYDQGGQYSNFCRLRGGNREGMRLVYYNLISARQNFRLSIEERESQQRQYGSNGQDGHGYYLQRLRQIEEDIDYFIRLLAVGIECEPPL